MSESNTQPVSKTSEKPKPDHEVVGDGFPKEKDISTPPPGSDQADDDHED